MAQFGSSVRGVRLLGRGLCATRRTASITLFVQALQPIKVAPKPGFLTGAILQAREVGPQLPRRSLHEPINAPVALPTCFYHPASLEIGEMLGDFYLRFAQNVLKVADAQGTADQQMQDPEAGGIAQTLIDPDELHAAVRADEITCIKGNMLCNVLVSDSGEA